MQNHFQTSKMSWNAGLEGCWEISYVFLCILVPWAPRHILSPYRVPRYFKNITFYPREPLFVPKNMETVKK